MQTALLVIAVVASIASLVMYLLQRRTMQQEIARLRSQLHENQEPAHPAGPHSVHDLREDADLTGHGELTPVALSQVAATLSAMLGRDVRISPVGDAPSSEEPHHSWAQQGCVSIQNSHDLSAAKHTTPAAGASSRTSAPKKRSVA
ncbi:MAG TPA: hypothetical protein VF447_13475 [Terriglobales bacterium]